MDLIVDCRLWIGQAGDGILSDQLGDLLRRLRSFRTEPVRGPVQRAEERPRGDGRVRRVQGSGTHAGPDERADAAFVLVALGDDARAQTGWEGVDFEMRGRTLDLVDQAEDVSDGQVAEAGRQRPAIPTRGRQRVQQPIGRAILAEEEQFVLASEIVIQVAG